MRKAVYEAEEAEVITLLLADSCILADDVNVSALTDPEKPGREPADGRASDREHILKGQRDKGNEEPCGKVERVCDGGNEHLLLDLPPAGRGVDGGEDEGEIADGDVGRPDDRQVHLLVDEGNDGQHRIGSREEDEKQEAELECLHFRVFGTLHPQ